MIKKIKYLRIFLIILFFLPTSVTYSNEYITSIFSENINENITRGGATIGDYSISESLTKVSKKDIPFGTLDILDKLKNEESKTRGTAGQNIYGKYSRSVVLIFNNDIKGTGSGSVIMKDIGAIITNWHGIQKGLAVWCSKTAGIVTVVWLVVAYLVFRSHRMDIYA